MDSRTTTTENREEGQMVGLKTLEERTSRSLDELEALAPGDAGWRDADTNTAAALDLLTGEAAALVFESRVLPHGADVQADAASYLSAREIRHADAPEGYAKLHADALDDYPALAGWLRSSIGIDAVRRHFEHSVRGMGERAPAATVETVDRYRRLIAAQLVERPDLDHDVEAAATFAEAVPALRERLAAARKVHVDAEAEAEAAARAKVRDAHLGLAKRLRALGEDHVVPMYLATAGRPASRTRHPGKLADELERGRTLDEAEFADLERSHRASRSAICDQHGNHGTEAKLRGSVSTKADVPQRRGKRLALAEIDELFGDRLTDRERSAGGPEWLTWELCATPAARLRLVIWLHDNQRPWATPPAAAIAERLRPCFYGDDALRPVVARVLEAAPAPVVAHLLDSVSFFALGASLRGLSSTPMPMERPWMVAFAVHGARDETAERLIAHEVAHAWLHSIAKRSMPVAVRSARMRNMKVADVDGDEEKLGELSEFRTRRNRHEDQANALAATWGFDWPEATSQRLQEIPRPQNGS